MIALHFAVSLVHLKPSSLCINERDQETAESSAIVQRFRVL